MRQPAPLSDLFRVKARYCRSVNLLSDSRAAGSLTNYIVTPLARAVLRRIAEGLMPGSANRAWSITGPYGAGKSACALFVARVLGHPVDQAARDLLRASDPALHQELFAMVLGLADGGFFLVLAVGSRQPLAHAVLQGLASALSNWRGDSPKVGQLRRDLQLLLDSSQRGSAPSIDEVVDVVDRTARAVRAGSKAILGLLMILDEVGKFLEYSALNPAHGDVFLLQGLAELASRSGDNPVGLISILHQGFEDYASRLGPVQRREWRKVQGRFEDVIFLEPQGDLLGLIGSAIARSAPFDGLASVVSAEAAEASGMGLVPPELGQRYSATRRKP